VKFGSAARVLVGNGELRVDNSRLLDCAALTGENVTAVITRESQLVISQHGVSLFLDCSSLIPESLPGSQRPNITWMRPSISGIPTSLYTNSETINMQILLLEFGNVPGTKPTSWSLFCHRYYRLHTRDRKLQINPLHLCPPSYAFPVYIWQRWKLTSTPYTGPRDTSTVYSLEEVTC
jgi:hypothetical protein